MSQKKLAGKVAVVTGASKGIGAGIARELAAQGATVVVNYASSEQDAGKVVADIAAAGGKAVALKGSVSQPDDMKRVFEAVKLAYGRVDILVNNAGVYAFGALEDLTVDGIRNMFDTNVIGVLLASQAALPNFPVEGGSIINIGSVVGEMPQPTSSVYAGTKGAVNTITRALAKELGARKIRVNAVNPGMTVTEGLKTAGMDSGDFANMMISTTPLGRLGEPADIAKLVAYLASDDAGWVTGSLIDAAGGWR